MCAKVVFVGDQAVGKTSIIKSILNQDYGNYEPTVGPEQSNITISVNSSKVELCLWDTAGQEVYQSLAPIYARNSEAAIMVFSVIDPTSFQNLSAWRDLLLNSSTLDSQNIYIVGNKTDLRDSSEDGDCVTTEEGLQYADELNSKYFEVSAKTGSNISELFQTIAGDIASEGKKDTHMAKKDTVVDITERNVEEKNNKKKECC
ncbi:Ras-related protein Rab-6B [Tritrichomonas foetus]|uniref:Ras-related protein Rab-6B n=1 Tax=Tritrichomonas foetus TaxID=1144522 RepID=A0A1J4JS63_9EUKA|nr:Ras-related protein Rab-6B [Tritrichomonas foetus]|eukprot:OHT01272.1 Ras-related protein Rab-6B [Tritrichomonas foetus]